MSRVATILAFLLAFGCAKGVKNDLLAPLPKPTPRPKVVRETSPVLSVPPAEMRKAMRDAYRLRPDRRFLAAVAEVPRLLGVKNLSPVEASFNGRLWQVRCGQRKVGILPEIPGFRDYESVLSAWAKAVAAGTTRSGGTVRREPRGGAVEAPFLWDPAVEELRGIDDRLRAGEDVVPLASRAASCLSRLAFQMADQLEIADLLPARALAALAIARIHDPRALPREEAFLAHAMGYSRHAATIAKSLPAGDPLRLFTEMADESLMTAAVAPGASAETRYLALERVASRREYGEWKAARDRLFGPNDALALAPAALHLRLQGQVEDNERREPMAGEVTRLMLRRLDGDVADSGGGPGERRPAELEPLLGPALERARGWAQGPFWDGPAMDAWYKSTVYSAFFQASLEPASRDPVAVALRASYSMPGPDVRKSIAFLKDTTALGAPVLGRVALEVRSRLNGDSPEMMEAARIYVRRADARVSGREDLVPIARGNIYDTALAEALTRSILSDVSDMYPGRRLQAALFLEDRAEVRRMVSSPRASAQDFEWMLSAWIGEKKDPEGLAQAFEEALRRYPESWELTYTYGTFERARKRPEKAYAAAGAWLARYGKPGATGYHHAHIAQAANANLLGRFDEALRLYRSAGGWGNAGVEALALDGLGKTDEALRRIREAATGSDFDENLTAWLKILWRNRRDDEIVDAIRATRIPPNLGTWCWVVAPVFGEVFLDAPPDRPAAAVRALRAKHVSAVDLMCFARPFQEAKKWEAAVKVQAAIEPPSVANEERLMDSYACMKSWQGANAALQWLRQVVPPAQRGPFSAKAYGAGEYDLLWSFIEDPGLDKHPEWVWIFRAAAAARQRGEALRRPELVEYYSRPSRERLHVMGRYLLGLAKEAELYAVATDAVSRSEVAFYMGIRAHGEGRYEDASDWYRVCVETDAYGSPRSHAARALIKWTEARLCLTRIREERL